MKENRIEEMMSSMKSFSKETYHKSELLTEMLNLQQEIVHITFNEEEVDTTNLKIYDVESKLKQMNEECGHIADDELKKFEDGSKFLCNLIRAEISGLRGESRAFRILDYIKSNNIVLKNIELSDGERKTELDAVVITPAGITIIEVKNPAKNIFIDDWGNYYRIGEHLKLDCHIAAKMRLKEELLRKALTGSEFENLHIETVVAFTNNRIEVQNKCKNIRTCFVSQLPYIIDDLCSDSNLSEKDMLSVRKSIEDVAGHEFYTFEFDAQQYKRDFAILLSKLEEAKEYEELSKSLIEVEYTGEQNHGKLGVWHFIKSLFHRSIQGMQTE